MIYLSGGSIKRLLGKRQDLGIMLTYMPRRTQIARPELKAVLNAGFWAVDNGCYTTPDLNIDSYLRWLKARAVGLDTCLFATAPDVLGDPQATWEMSKNVLPKIQALDYSAALVAQDGIEDRKIEWGAFDVLFIGGTTEWKLSEGAFWLMEEARKKRKWVHMGRVNSRRRLRAAAMAGCHSVDGTHLVFGPDANLIQVCNWLGELQRQPFLFQLPDSEIAL